MKPRCSASCLTAVSIAFFASATHAQPDDRVETTFEMPVPVRNIEQAELEAMPFTFVRIKYSSESAYDGSWRVDYPDAETSFLQHFEEVTGLDTDRNGLVLELTDPALSRYPFIYIVEGGYLTLNDNEVVALREYLSGGGFLMVDDFWGEEEGAALTTQTRRVFPDLDPVELRPEHEIFRSFYEINDIPQIPGITEIVRRPDRGVSSDEAQVLGLIDEDGRLMAIFCQNMDFGDGWEHVDDPAHPKQFSLGGAVALGVNIVIYALTH
ncbi:MAG TPA: DUF4159 domain-containing protein [Gammaproteobacteria bacterium]